MEQLPLIGNAEQKHLRWKSRLGSLVAIVVASGLITQMGRFQLPPAVLGVLLVVVIIATQLPFYLKTREAPPKEGLGWSFILVLTAGFSMLLFSGRFGEATTAGVLTALAFAVPLAVVLRFRWEVVPARRRQASKREVRKPD